MSRFQAKTRRTANSILWIGDGRRAEFAPTFDALSARAALTQCTALSDAELPASEFAPALVIVAQGFAGEIGEADVVRLRRRYPTAALVRIVASWCEGELRSAPPVHGIRRCAAHQALPWLLADLARLERGERPEWGLPATATEEESLMATIAVRRILPVSSMRLGIAASDAQVERWLHDLCRQASSAEPAICNFAANGAWSASDAPAVILWDAPHTAAISARELESLRRDVPLGNSSIIALADFPRREQIAHWREAGVVEVLGKPVIDAVLLASIDRQLNAVAS